MELKEYLMIFKNNFKYFLIVLVAVVLGGFLIQDIIPVRYKVETDLNITRVGYQKNTNEYRYDEFYRLQADERFADTVVQWLKSPKVEEEILRKDCGGIEKLKPRRLSSQMISISFLLKHKNDAQKAVKCIDKIVNEKTKKLNKFQNDPNWFKVLVGDFVIKENKISYLKLFGLLFFVGIFVGFWVVYFIHYFSENKKDYEYRNRY